MQEARHLLSQFNRDDLWHEANNLVVALNLSLMDDATPFNATQTEIAICDDLFDNLVEVKAYMDTGFKLDDGQECIREIWECILKLDRTTFESYRVTRAPDCVLIEALSLNDEIGCAVEISIYPADNVVPFPSRFLRKTQLTL